MSRKIFKYSSVLFVLSLLGAGCQQPGITPEPDPTIVETPKAHAVSEKGSFIGEEGDTFIEYNLRIEDFDESFQNDGIASYNGDTPVELNHKRSAQFASVGDFKVFKDFSFSHGREKSGIDFLHRVTNDSSIDFMFDHYDHGNGLAVADINNDGLYDIYFVSQIGENQLWQNNGDGTFKNITEQAGVGLERKVSVSASFADIDNDGDADLYVTTVRHGNVLFENGGEGVFRNISKYSNTNYNGHSSGAVFFDYDLDGLLDLLVVNVGGYTSDKLGVNGYYIGNPLAFQHRVIDSYTEDSVLYKNIGANKFKDVTREMNLVDSSWSGDATIVDLNNDRYPDVYLLSMEGPDHYYENIGGKKFVDKTSEYFPFTSSGAMGVKFFDYDNDSDMDLYVTDMHSDMGFERQMDSIEKESLKSDEVTNWIIEDEGDVIYGNSFYKNEGSGEMSEISAELGLENYWPWGISVADINADGFDDVFVTSSMNYLYKYLPNLMLLNNKGEGFLKSEYLLGIEPRLNNEIEKKWFDLDCLRRNKDHLECKDRSGQVSVDRGPEVTVMGSLGSRSSVVFDIEGDGDLDIITNEFNDEPLVLVSNLSSQKKINYLEVLLAGTESNHDGLGASVTVVAGDDIYRKYNDGSSGYLSHSRMPLYFGLGDHKSVDKIVVDWPSGKQTIIDTISQINKRQTISE